jgi:hypothetical protein
MKFVEHVQFSAPEHAVIIALSDKMHDLSNTLTHADEFDKAILATVLREMSAIIGLIQDFNGPISKMRKPITQDDEPFETLISQLYHNKKWLNPKSI